MAYGVLVISDLNRYEFDNWRLAPVRMQFAERVRFSLQDSVVLYQSRSKRYGSGYFAVAKLLDADVSTLRPGHLSLSFAEPIYFSTPVVVRASEPIIESYVRDDLGRMHGRRFAEDFRRLASDEYVAIVAGSAFDQLVRERKGGLSESEKSVRHRVAQQAWWRSTKAREIALPLYKFRCAFTGQRLLSVDGLSSGLEVCHVLSVEAGGEDIASNLLVACPDFHKRYDQGTVDILENYTWMPIGPYHDDVVRHWVGARQLFVPDEPSDRLDFRFLAAHRQQLAERRRWHV